MAKVSILMNCYNCEKYLKEALDSVYAQTFSDWEIIFVDNCSSDNTSEILKSYDNRMKYYRLDNLLELGEARNFGLTKCKSEYLAFLDTDDVWFPNKLEEQIKLLDNSDYQMCYGSVLFIDKNGKEIGSLKVKTTSDIFAQQLKRYEINMQTVLLRNNIGIAFDKTKQFSPDYELFMNILVNYQVVALDNYLVKYRKLENSLTSKKIDRWWIENKETLDKIFYNNPSLKNKYQNEYKLAYAKVAYYKAQYLIKEYCIKEARIELSKYKYTSFKYFFFIFYKFIFYKNMEFIS